MAMRILAMTLCGLLSAGMPAQPAALLKHFRQVRAWPAALQEARSNGHRSVQMQLRNGQTLGGMLAAVGPESCTLDTSDGRRIAVPYDQVQSVKWRQNAFSHGARVALIAIAVVVVLVLVAAVELKKS